MPRVRWAQPCRAKTDRGVCRSWSVRGTYVCRVHGGAARQVRYQGKVRLLQVVMEREFRADMARWRERSMAWHVDRIMVTAALLDMDPMKVDRWDILEAHRRFGRPPLSDEAPQPVFRHDGRLRRFIADPK